MPVVDWRFSRILVRVPGQCNGNGSMDCTHISHVPAQTLVRLHQSCHLCESKRCRYRAVRGRLHNPRFFNRKAHRLMVVRRRDFPFAIPTFGSVHTRIKPQPPAQTTVRPDSHRLAFGIGRWFLGKPRYGSPPHTCNEGQGKGQGHRRERQFFLHRAQFAANKQQNGILPGRQPQGLHRRHFHRRQQRRMPESQRTLRFVMVGRLVPLQHK